jgi:EmrB/QacA subfamily drug resistance transporter
MSLNVKERESMGEEKPAIGLITTGLLLGLILSSLDQTIIATAMPTVIKDVGGLSYYSWAFSIYMLASTTTMPLYGKLADLFGRRLMYLIGLFIFLLGSTLCGFAGNMGELIIYRGIQGLGAGALMPVAFTIIGDIFPPERRGKFMGLFGAVFAISSILGPTLGGVIVEYWDWQWIFYINIPIGVPAMFIIAKALKESKSKEKRSIDWFGALTLSGAVVSILLALVLAANHQGGGTPWGSKQIIGLFGAGAVLLALFLWIETKVKEPIIPLQLFKIRTIAFSNIAGFFVSAGIFGAITYIPLYVQGVNEVSPSIAGYILTPLMLSTVVTSTLSGRWMSRVSYRMILIPSLALMVIGFILLSQMTVDTTKLQMILYMILTGLGMGAIYPTLGTAAQSSVDMRTRGVATSSNQFFRSMGGTIGVSLLGSLMVQQMTSGLVDLTAQLTAFPADQLQKFTNPQLLLDSEARASLPQEVLLGLQTVFSHALNHVFLVGVFFVSMALVASIIIGKARLVPSSKE